MGGGDFGLFAKQAGPKIYWIVLSVFWILFKLTTLHDGPEGLRSQQRMSSQPSRDTELPWTCVQWFSSVAIIGGHIFLSPLTEANTIIHSHCHSIMNTHKNKTKLHHFLTPRTLKSIWNILHSVRSQNAQSCRLTQINPLILFTEMITVRL